MASIRKRILPSGATTYLVDYRDQNGKRRSKQFKRRRDAEDWRADTLVKVRLGIFTPDVATITVKDATDLWLEACAVRMRAGKKMERSTFLSYEGHVRLHICDAETGIGGIKLSRLRKARILKFRDDLAAKKLSDATIRKILKSLKMTLAHAQENDVIAINPAEGIMVISASRVSKKPDIPTKRAVRALLEATTDNFRPHLLVAAFCGLRASESRGLAWDNVDFEEGYIHVRQRADRWGVIGEPKSAAGKRSVPMGPLVANALREWRLRSLSNPQNLVFPNQRGKIQNYSNLWERDLQPLLKKLDIKLRWHDLRHFAVSLWIEHGFPPKAVLEFAGHASITVTYDRYGHLFPTPEHHQGMAEIEDRFFTETTA